MKFAKILVHFGYIFLISALFTNCSSGTKKHKTVNDSVKRSVNFILPDNMVVYSPFNKNNLDSTQISNSALKIYTYIDVSCPSCLSSIKKWKNFADQLNEFKIPVILICQSEDNYELLKYLCEKKEIPVMPFPFYFDTKNQFFDRNQFLNPSPGNHTVLTDQNNLVLQTGDPTFSKKIKVIYLDVIKANINH